MNSRVIFQPAGDSDAMGHFVDTIEAPVDINKIVSKLTPQQNKALGDIFEGRMTIPVWGVTPGKNDVNYRKWQKIQPGDVTLFSRKGKVFASATIVAKVHNKDLAIDLWQSNSAGNTREYIYFLDELTDRNISYEMLNQVVGYKKNYIIQSFSVLSESKSELLLDAFDLRSLVYFPDVKKQEYYDIVSTLSDVTSSLDREGKVKSRIEQNFLRSSLFGKKSIGQCCICGRTLPVALLWAAHIKKRSACSLQEKKDYKNIVAPMCKLGCDELYERKYISINPEGQVVITKKGVSTPFLKEYLEDLEGRMCLSWNEDSKKYFTWHHWHHNV